jgi:NAD(P)-dependent dehydrogenase (short-subunit alcohol dehydrogenase family)
MKLAKRVAIISGANQGLGFEIAKQFVQQGASLMLCARNAELLDQAKEKLLTLAKLETKLAAERNSESDVKILIKPCDVANPQHMQDLVQATLRELGRIDILVANAGVYGCKGPIDEVDWEEWSRAIDINLKGTVLQCRAVLPQLKKQGYGKIIIISGGGATKPMPNLSAYAASKAGVVRFAETLAEEVREYNIDVNTVAPGALNTRLLDEILQAGPGKVGKEFYEQSLRQKENGGTSLDVGASLCTFLACSLSDGITGKLLSAVWDPWAKLPEFIEQLNKSDVYTLRRITAQERGIEWD